MKSVFLALILSLAPAFAHAHDGHDQPGFAHLIFANGAIHAHCTWKEGPTGDGESVLLIEWKKGADHSAIEPPGRFEVAIVMPSMPEMHNPPTQLERVTDDHGAPETGAFRVSSIYFTMAGDWEVQVTLHYPDGSAETQTIPVDIDDGMDMGHSGHLD